ncbi:hypothetical protein ACFLU3_02595 [Chloroflexota bacterium]
MTRNNPIQEIKRIPIDGGKCIATPQCITIMPSCGTGRKITIDKTTQEIVTQWRIFGIGLFSPTRIPFVKVRRLVSNCGRDLYDSGLVFRLSIMTTEGITVDIARVSELIEVWYVPIRYYRQRRKDGIWSGEQLEREIKIMLRLPNEPESTTQTPDGSEWAMFGR